MLFICEFELLEGHLKPEHDHAIIEANSREQALEKVFQAFQADRDTEGAAYLYEVPREEWANIPINLIDKPIPKSVAEKLRADCGIASSCAAQEILAKFPGPVTLQPSKLKWAGGFFAGLICAGAGALPLLLGDPPGGWDLELDFCVGFLLVCGVIVMVASVVLVKGRMTLTPAGFEMRSWVTRRRCWKDVSGFSTASVGFTDTVVYEDRTRRGF